VPNDQIGTLLQRVAPTAHPRDTKRTRGVVDSSISNLGRHFGPSVTTAKRHLEATFKDYGTWFNHTIIIEKKVMIMIDHL
jgi:hypothetical protein